MGSMLPFRFPSANCVGLSDMEGRAVWFDGFGDSRFRRAVRDRAFSS